MKKDIKERVTSYETACQELGEEPIVDFGNDTKDEIAFKKLKTIIRALNEGWVANYRDNTQLKWLPWFKVLASSGFGFGDTYYGYSAPVAGDAARLCLRDKNLAIHAGKNATEIYKGIILK